MADESQVAMLKRSVEEWNRWRQEHHAAPILLEGADLRHADLANAILNRAVLDNANLAFANLESAYLNGASLVGADLMFANLSHASLAHATFRNARLVGTNLTLAGVSNANFSGAKLGGTAFNMVELKLAEGLEDCHHEMPSPVDHSTIKNSPGLPESFLRGCGVPEEVIATWRQLSPQRVLFDSCFISHSSADKEFAQKLREDLQKAGIKSWFDDHDMTPGKKLHEQIDEAIGVHDRLLLILSEASMGSRWVKTEIANALDKEQRSSKRVLFPVSLVPFDRLREWKNFNADIGIDAAREIREYFILDFSDWKNHDSYKASFDKLLKGLKAEEPPKPNPA